jgi:hypothetical protein
MSLTQIGARIGPYMPWLFGIGILIGVLMFYRYYRLLHDDDEKAGSSSDLFATLHEARDKMTDTEFRRVRERLIGGQEGKPARAEIARRDLTLPAPSRQAPGRDASPEIDSGSAAAQ